MYEKFQVKKNLTKSSNIETDYPRDHIIIISNFWYSNIVRSA